MVTIISINVRLSFLYLQALDIWMGACTAFVFSALIEFTIVNYIWRKDLKARGGGSSKWWVINHSVFNKGQFQNENYLTGPFVTDMRKGGTIKILSYVSHS